MHTHARYLEVNHTSVIGMREAFLSRGSHVVCVAPNDMRERRAEGPSFETGLFVYPAQVCEHRCFFPNNTQSNFSGDKYPLTWVHTVRSKDVLPCGIDAEWKVVSSSFAVSECQVCIDAASFVATSPLNLRECNADFITLSFYKIFGFPTGLGALIVKKDRYNRYSRHTHQLSQRPLSSST
jgi:molybdenum cofactor sulfurtransferase